MGRSWVGLGPCKERRMMELILGQQETVQHIAAPHRVQRAGTCFKTHKPHARPTHFVTRTCCSARDSLRGSFHTYPPGPRALGAAIGTAFEAVVPSLVAFGSAEL